MAQEYVRAASDPACADNNCTDSDAVKEAPREADSESDAVKTARWWMENFPHCSEEARTYRFETPRKADLLATELWFRKTFPDSTLKLPDTYFPPGVFKTT